MSNKQLAESLVDLAGGSVDQRERELYDLIWTASHDGWFRKAVERAMKQGAREARDEKEDLE